MKYIIRRKSLLTGKPNLEDLHTIKKFPVFMGCTEQPSSEDIFATMQWQICQDTGMIQLRKLLPLDILYMASHNDGIGKVWADHYAAFSSFLKQHKFNSILEIGGAHDIIAKQYLEKYDDTKWTIIEPHPIIKSSKNIKVLKGWFDHNFQLNYPIDAIVHSHVIEHIYDPVEFLEHINQFLQVGQKQLFSFPNLYEFLKNKYTNGLNFEHTAFLSEYFMDELLKAYGFKILNKEYFQDHSIFYATEKVASPSKKLKFENHYREYKKLFMDFVKHHEDEVNLLNQKIMATKAPIYLFGAHIFSQYLIAFGLKTKKIVSVLDNSPLKQGKRLYGTNFQVESPKVLRDKGKVVVILRAGMYNEEIKKDILENINQKVIFW